MGAPAPITGEIGVYQNAEGTAARPRASTELEPHASHRPEAVPALAVIEARIEDRLNVYGKRWEASEVDAAMSIAEVRGLIAVCREARAIVDSLPFRLTDLVDPHGGVARLAAALREVGA